jgi:hypothetical protein
MSFWEHSFSCFGKRWFMGVLCCYKGSHRAAFVRCG